MLRPTTAGERVDLEPAPRDDAARRHLDDALARVFEPQIVGYIAGSDPHERGPLGSLQLTRAGLLERDWRVARFAVESGCPLVVLPAGGYSDESSGRRYLAPSGSK